MANHISFTYWCGGEHDNELNLLDDGKVVFQKIDDQENRGTPHGNWYFGLQEELVVSFDHRARGDYIKRHVFKKLNNMTNCYTLYERDGEAVPGVHHKYRCLLILNGTSYSVPRTE